ncbi:hypothetical protein BWQ92_18055 [Arthrobacter sp. QXT-31]|nr:hypothetical protein BWQ92_18055 [Arthrobacter sp. QXT-31]
MQETAESVELALNEITAKIDWTPLTLINGYSAYTGSGGYYNGLRASKNGNTIRVNGIVKNPTTGDPKTTIAVLPVALRPMFSVYQPVTTGNAAGSIVIGNVAIGSNGNITYQNGATDPTFVAFNFTIAIN